MSLTKEQLLKPRILVIAGWPQIKSMEDDVIIEAGDILCQKEYGDNNWFVKDEAGVLAIHDKWIDQYPHLFKRIEHWWEHRSLSDMPVHIKDLTSGKVGVVRWKIIEGRMWIWSEGWPEDSYWPIERFNTEPADESDYKTYQESLLQTTGV